MPLRKIKLHGKLGKLFGKEWELNVASVGEAIRAIDSNTKGKFSKYLTTEGAFKKYKVCINNNKYGISKEEINIPYEKGDIHIIPVLKGSDKLVKIIIGVVLIVVGYFTGTMGFLGKLGISLIVGGAAEYLAPNPKTESVERKTSYLFQGNANTINQGQAVGTVYGRALVSPMPISISMNNSDMNYYDGEKVSLGSIGILSKSLIQYSYKQGTATLIGFEELSGFESIPPKKYRRLTLSGSDSVNGPSTYSSDYSGSNYFDVDGTYHSGTVKQCTADGVPRDPDYGVTNATSCYGSVCFAFRTVISSATTAYNQTSGGMYSSCPDIWGASFSCSCLGYSYSAQSSGLKVLSEEDTDADAVNRATNALSWSAWQSTPITSYQNQRTTGFSFLFRIVKTRTVTLSETYPPGFSFNYSVTYERRLQGSSDPWVEAETVETTIISDSNGNITLPEIPIPNISGYETQIKSHSINYN